MKHVFFTLSILFCIHYSASARKAKGTDSGTPILTFVNNDTLYDFGSIHINEQAANDFELKNTGDADLVITNIYCKSGSVFCKCGKRTLKPGKTSVITITYTAGDVTGSFDADIFVTYNSPTSANAKIHITGATVPTTAPIPPKAGKTKQGRGKVAR